MLKFILNRLFQAIITALILLTIVFIIIRLSGDPIVWMVSPRASQEVRAEVIHRYGLDKSIIIQYFNYLGSMIKGDFGDSFYYSRPAMQVVMERVPVTLKLTGTAILISILLGLPFGIYAAVQRGRIPDIILRGVAFFAISTPSFWIGLMLIFIFSVKLRILPGGGDSGISSLILPAFTLALGLGGGIMRLTRSGMLGVWNNDYITMARAKGVPEVSLIWKHAFKNASIPVVTMVMMLMVIVISGDVLTENIFSWNGLGRLVMSSVFNRDYPIIQAFTMVICFTFVCISLLADILYAYINPKIRY